MFRELDTAEMETVVGGADATINLGALGTITVDAAMPALAAVAEATNDLLIGLTGVLGGVL
ncbi:MULTISPECIES: hypothetical protein [unclassified Thioalkalivibrio]|uniref:hypothetical protein n=1 Tax=unclassified Thioalkalivibrio TaxID=2621013 RepID=UPI000362CF9B|nr:MULTISPECIES: hypothetical protein [unclassified Thioalkalivibrio]